jgi:cytochrome c
MFDTMTLTKALGGFCGALLVFLLGGWLAETIYHNAHGDHEQAYYVEVPGADDGHQEVVEDGPDFATLFASADADAGASAFRACQSCHAIADSVNGTGPHLYGIVGRPVQAVEGFRYSGALISVNDVWTPEELNAFITNPRSYAPGTSMSYNGMRDAQDRANLIAYLDSLDG